jgi:hypothetical protein
VAVGVLAITVAGAGWVVLDGIQRIDDAGIASPETFETLRNTVEISQQTTLTVADALEDLEVLVETLASSAATTAVFVDETAKVTSTRIPESLVAIEQAMPGLIDAAEVIDDSLSALTFLGVDYRPETPFDDALREVQASLDGLAEDVSAQGATLELLVPEMEAVHITASSLTSRVSETRANLRTAGSVLGEYRAILDTAQGAIGPDTGAVLRYGPWIRIPLVVIAFVGIALAMTMWKLADATDGGVWHSTETGNHTARTGNSGPHT